MGKAKRRVSPKVKFQVVLEALTEGKTHGRIAKVYGVHPISLGLWKKTLLERGAEIFAGDSAKEDYERRIAELELRKGSTITTANEGTQELAMWLR